MHVIGWFAGEQTQSSDWLAGPTEGQWQDTLQAWKKSWEEEREKEEVRVGGAGLQGLRKPQ